MERVVVRWVVFASLVILLTPAFVATAQRTRPHRDPSHPHLVEGRVLDAAGRPLGNVTVLRTRSAEGREPFSRGTYERVTGADGAFRFQFSGLGWGTGQTWYLAASRPGCPTTVVTVQLSLERVDGRDTDLARNVVIRMPRCQRRIPG